MRQSSYRPFGLLGWPSGRYSCWDQGPSGSRTQGKGHINKRLCLKGKTRTEESSSIKSNQIYFPMKSFTGQQRTKIQIKRGNCTQRKNVQTWQRMSCLCVHTEISALKDILFFHCVSLVRLNAVKGQTKLKFLDAVNSKHVKSPILLLKIFSTACSCFCYKVATILRS